MTLLVPWNRYRPGELPPACPRCETRPDNPHLSVRHDEARWEPHYPAWILCSVCRGRLPLELRHDVRRFQYPAGVYVLEGND